MSALVIAMVLWGLAHEPAEVEVEVVPTLTIEPDFPLARNLMLVEVVTCITGNVCLVDVVGEEGILGEQVAIGIHGYQSPRTTRAWCETENRRGQKAASYLTEKMRNADLVALIGPYKRLNSPLIEGRLLVDGHDIADWMVKLGLGAPLGIKVDWCVESPRTLEI